MPRKAEPTVDLAIPIGTTATAALLQMSAPKLIALTHQNVLHHIRDSSGLPVGGKYLLNQAVADYVNYLNHQREHDRGIITTKPGPGELWQVRRYRRCGSNG